MRMRTLPKWISFEALRAAIVYPLSQCEAEPLAAEHVPQFEELLVLWSATHDQKLELDDMAAKAHARCDRAGVRINRVVDRVAAETLFLTGRDRGHVTYTHFFKKPPSTFKKIRMSARIAAMRGWIKDLSLLGQPTLTAIIPELTAALKEADDAHQQKISIEDEKSRFRDFGGRKQLVDKVNVVCKSVHGKLGALPHENLGLPADFADRFFLHDDSRSDDKDREEPPTVESVTAKLEKLASEVAENEALLEELKAQEAKESKAAAAIEADKAALAELQKIMAETEKRAAELKARIERA